MRLRASGGRRRRARTRRRTAAAWRTRSCETTRAVRRRATPDRQESARRSGGTGSSRAAGRGARGAARASASTSARPVARRPAAELGHLHVRRQVLGIGRDALETEHAGEVVAGKLVVAGVVEVAEPPRARASSAWIAIDVLTCSRAIGRARRVGQVERVDFHDRRAARGRAAPRRGRQRPPDVQLEHLHAVERVRDRRAGNLKNVHWSPSTSTASVNGSAASGSSAGRVQQLDPEIDVAVRLGPGAVAAVQRMTRVGRRDRDRPERRITGPAPRAPATATRRGRSRAGDRARARSARARSRRTRCAPPRRRRCVMPKSCAEVILMIVERDDRGRPFVAGDRRDDLELETLVALADGEQLPAAAEERVGGHVRARVEAERCGQPLARGRATSPATPSPSPDRPRARARASGTSASARRRPTARGGSSRT